MRIPTIASLLLLSLALGGSAHAAIRIDVNPGPAFTGQMGQVEFANYQTSRETVTVVIQPLPGSSISEVAGQGVVCLLVAEDTSCQLEWRQRLVVSYLVLGEPCQETDLFSYSFESGARIVEHIQTAIPGHCQYLPETFSGPVQ